METKYTLNRYKNQGPFKTKQKIFTNRQVNLREKILRNKQEQVKYGSTFASRGMKLRREAAPTTTPASWSKADEACQNRGNIQRCSRVSEDLRYTTNMSSSSSKSSSLYTIYNTIQNTRRYIVATGREG